MSEQITAEIVTEEPQTETPTTSDPGDETPTQIEDEPAEVEEPSDPGPVPETPEVSATVTQGASGVWAVNIFTQHPDTLDVAVNGKAVWRGIP